MKGYIYVDETGLKTEKHLNGWIRLCIDFNPKAKAAKKKKQKIRPRLLHTSLLFLLLQNLLSAQTYLHTDPINMGLRNYNIGFEKRIENRMYNIQLMKLSRAFVDTYEWPTLVNCSGFRVQTEYRKFFIKLPSFYYGFANRIEFTKFDELDGWNSTYLLNRKDFRFVLGTKIGVRIGKGPFKVDFGFGPSIRLLSRKESDGDLASTPLIGEEIPQPNPSAERYNNVGIRGLFHLQLVYQIAKK